MAKAKDEPKIVLERVYNVPLRKGYLKAPEYRRTQKASRVFRAFVIKHMKSDNVSIGKELNDFLWKHGIRNPPHHIKINAIKYDSGLVKVNLFGAKIEEKEETKKKVKKEVTEKIEKKIEEEQEEKTTREEEKEELKELKQMNKKERAPKLAAMPKQVEQHQQAPMNK